MPADPILIVGGGQAGGELAITLRKEGWDGRIVVACGEPHAPYQRPPLSKGFLAGEIGADRLQLKRPAVYEKAQVEFATGSVVESIDRDARRITLSGGEALAYSKLALCTGSRPRTLPGTEPTPQVHVLRCIEDADALRPALATGKRLVIIGGGYIGLEVAATARKQGTQVTVLEALPRILARVATAPFAAFVAGLHAEAGVTIRCGVMVGGMELDAGKQLRGVRLDDGEVIEADQVLVGIGIVPNTELAAGAGLAVDNGIVTDACGRTSDPDIVAAGDCANQPNDWAGGRARLESVPNALESARSAAAAMCGNERPNGSLPWFWSDQHGLKLQMAGFPAEGDVRVVRGEPGARAFTAYYLREGNIAAAESVGQPREFALARRLIAARASSTPAALSMPDADLESLLPNPA